MTVLKIPPFIPKIQRTMKNLGFKKQIPSTEQPSETLLHLVALYKSLGMKLRERSGCKYVLRLPSASEPIGTVEQKDSTIYIQYFYPFSELEVRMPKTIIIPDALAMLEGFLGVRGIGYWVETISHWYGIPKSQIQYDSKSITIQLE
ncbi:MAG: hypothetical protein WBA39_34535 [Rivularia sp. (in: cyanobacteria)]